MYREYVTVIVMLPSKGNYNVLCSRMMREIRKAGNTATKKYGRSIFTTAKL